MNRRRLLSGVIGALLGCFVFVGAADASNVSAGLGGGPSAEIPTWLFVITGGGVVAASSMLSMLIADRELLVELHEPERSIPATATLRRAGGLLGGTFGILGLLAVFVVGVLGPSLGTANFAVLLVFVGGRSFLTMAAYLVGNPWPALNPWRRLASPFPSGHVSYPSRFGYWPAVGALLVLIYLEVVLPVTSAPRVLSALVGAYTVVSVAGAIAVGPEDWFQYIDPVSVWFRFYSAAAPLQRSDDGWELRVPGARLRETGILDDPSGVAFVIVLVYELTYSGFVATPAGVGTIETIVGIGVPPRVTYLLLLAAGYAGFYIVYRAAAGKSREYAKTYLTADYIAYRFAPPLLGIAAGYHLAHYAGFGLSLSPSLLQTAIAPLSFSGPPLELVLPSWFGTLNILFLLCGHLVAIWYAHATSFDLFPGRLQAIRSQYPFVAVMVIYTMISIWILSMPTEEPPFVGAG